MREHYDVIIVGGGLAGMSLSCLLGREGIKVACIDQSSPASSIARDLRTTAISYGSRQVLEQAGVWSRLHDAACPINDIHILDGDSPVLLQFMHTEVGDKSFGWIVDNADLRTALQDTMNTHACVDHIAPAQVQGFDVNEAGAAVETNAGTLSARLIIGADGRRSLTRDYMDVRVREWSYNQRAVICTVSHENPHNNVAVEHFWADGPFAILPMCDDEHGRHRSSVVFTEHGAQNERSLMDFNDRDFETLLYGRFPDTYGQVKLIGKRAAYPLNLVHAAAYIAPRMALVADAAHGIHPIAGQGLNLGFRDIKTLADLVTEAHKAGHDIGDMDLLRTYQRLRRPDNVAMVAVTDGLNRLFSNKRPFIGQIRRAGLRMVACLAPAKQFFMRQAMGDRF